jgi:hypothetical protein
MAGYSSSNFKLLIGGLSGTSVNFWLLDTVDAIGTVNTAAYVSDATTKGAKKGDLVLVRIWDTIGTGTVSAQYWCWFIAAGDLTDGLAITATNTD